MHICMDEVLAFLAVIPFISFLIPLRLRAWIHSKVHKKKCPHEGDSK